jgi:serine/threonine protein kinase
LHERLIGQVFARKLVRQFGQVTREDIDNEAKAIMKLCEGNKSDTIVEVMRHGWLPSQHTMYYIDMELCGYTLKSYIQDRDARMFAETDPRTVNSQEISPVLSISYQIARGLEFIHGNGSVHRDLKPSNGKSLLFEHKLT